MSRDRNVDPRAQLHGNGARAEGDEADDGDVEFLEDLFGPPDLEVDDGADDGRLGLRAVGGDIGLEFEGRLLAGWIRSRAHRRTRDEWVLREGRGNMSGGGAGDGGNDEGSVEITGGKVGAKLHARVKD